MSLLLALDQGTTSSRAALIGPAGEIVALAQEQFPQYFPQPGWVEHDPEELWQSQLACIEAVLREAKVTARDVEAVGLTNQRETTLVFDRRSGAPIHRAIVWQDRRTAAACGELRAAGRAEWIQQKTGLVIDPYFSATKLAWILDHVPEARQRAERGELAFATVDTWLCHRLSGGALHVTDASNASRTLLHDLARGDFDEELLECFRIPPPILPTIVPSSGVIGECRIEPLRGVPIAGILGDQQAATAGQVCIEPGMAKNTYGTGCFLLWNTGDRPRFSQHQLLTTPLWVTPKERAYALEGSVFVGGALVQWLRDGLGLLGDAAEIETLAASVDSSEGVLLVPAFVGLGAPHWDPHARGALLGLSRGTTRAHVARAALDAIAFQVADLTGAMQEDAGEPLRELRVDGGAARNDLLLQLQADLLQVPVVRPEVTETTMLGAAYMAGLAVGFFRGWEAIQSHWRLDREFLPAISAAEAASRREVWQHAVRATRSYRPPGT